MRVEDLVVWTGLLSCSSGTRALHVFRICYGRPDTNEEAFENDREIG